MKPENMDTQVQGQQSDQLPLPYWGDHMIVITMLDWTNKKQKWVPLRAMKTFIRKKIGHTT